MNLDELNVRLTASATEWLAAAVVDIKRSPQSITHHFPAASRQCGRTSWNSDDPQGVTDGCLDDLAREAMLAALPTRGVDLVAVATDLYRHGDAHEKRGVLRGAHRLDPAAVGASLLPLVDDALRSNDPRLIASATQQYGAEHLSADAFRQAVVKCVFVGVPLAAVVGLRARRDAELARMLVDLAHERVAAGRPIPPDIPPLVAAFPASLDRPDLPAAFIERLTAQLPVISSTIQE